MLWYSHKVQTYKAGNAIANMWSSVGLKIMQIWCAVYWKVLPPWTRTVTDQQNIRASWALGNIFQHTTHHICIILNPTVLHMLTIVVPGCSCTL